MFQRIWISFLLLLNVLVELAHPLPSLDNYKNSLMGSQREKDCKKELGEVFKTFQHFWGTIKGRSGPGPPWIL
jgi:hypothetical protein